MDLSRQAGKFVSFSLSVLKFGGGYLPREDGRGVVSAAADRDGGGVLNGGGAGKEEEAEAAARSNR